MPRPFRVSEPSALRSSHRQWGQWCCRDHARMIPHLRMRSSACVGKKSCQSWSDPTTTCGGGLDLAATVQRQYPSSNSPSANGNSLCLTLPVPEDPFARSCFRSSRAAKDAAGRRSRPGCPWRESSGDGRPFPFPGPGSLICGARWAVGVRFGSARQRQSACPRDRRSPASRSACCARPTSGSGCSHCRRAGRLPSVRERRSPLRRRSG